jgi:hypothetical protein
LAGNEVVLKGADSTFRSVAAMEMWWYWLEVDFLAFYEVFESSRGFVVEILESCG